MNIKTKFKVGDQVFIIRQKADSYHTNCPTCGGTGKVHIRETGGELDCPSCNGKGFDIQIDINYYKEDAVVNKILTNTNENGTDVLLSLIINGQYIYLDESSVFTSKEADKIIEKGTAKDHVSFFNSSVISFDPDLMKFVHTSSVKFSDTSSTEYNEETDVDNSTGKEIPKKLF